MRIKLKHDGEKYAVLTPWNIEEPSWFDGKAEEVWGKIVELVEQENASES